MAIAFSTEAFVVLWDPNPSGGTQGDRSIQKVWYLIYGATLVVAWFSLRAGRWRGFYVPYGFAAIFGFATASLLWTVDPSTTLRRLVALALTIAVGYLCAAVLEPGQLLNLLRFVFTGLVIASLVMIVVANSQSRDLLIAGAYRGVFFQKNVFGEVAAFGFIFEVVAMSLRLTRLRHSVFLATLDIAGIALSRSTTAVVVVALGAPLILAFAVRSRRGVPILFIPVALLFLTGAYLIAIDRRLYESGLNLLGKDPTLTNRTYVWAAVNQLIGQHSALGWGYGAFWSANPESPQSSLQRYFNYPIVEAHSGILGIASGLGYVGVAIVGAVVVSGLWRSARRYVRNGSQDAFIAGSLLLVVVLYSVDEGYLLTQNVMITILFSTGYFLSLRDNLVTGEGAKLVEREVSDHTQPSIGAVRL